MTNKKEIEKDLEKLTEIIENSVDLIINIFDDANEILDKKNIKEIDEDDKLIISLAIGINEILKGNER